MEAFVKRLHEIKAEDPVRRRKCFIEFITGVLEKKSIILEMKVKSLTLFVTHYPPLCDLERVYPEHVANYHMAFLLNEPEHITDDEDGDIKPEFITFLYQLTEGAAGGSYGLNVARLAGIPDHVLHIAARKARELENTVNSRRKNRSLLADLWKVMDRKSLMDWMQTNISTA